MRAERLPWRNHLWRSQLIFLGLLISLYLPIPLNSLLISAFILHSFFAKKWLENVRKSNPVIILLFVSFFIVNGLSLIYSENLADGLNRLQTKLSFLFMPLAIAGSGIYLSRGFRKQALNIFFLASLLAALAALLHAAYVILEAGSFYKIADDQGTMVKQYYFTYTHLAFFIMHPGYFSLYVSSAIFIGIYLYATGSNILKKKWIQLFCIGFLFTFLILLQGRISILAFLIMFFAGVIIYFFTSGKFLKGSLIIAIPLTAIIALVVIAPPALTRRFTEFDKLSYQMDAPSVYDFNGLTIRLAEWHCAMDAISEKPILGYGLGDGVEALFESYKKNGFVVGLEREYNAHNQLLETLLKTGIAGLIFLVGMLVWFVVRAIRQRDLLLFVLSGLLILSIMTESMLERHSAITFLCSIILFLGMSSPRGQILTKMKEGR